MLTEWISWIQDIIKSLEHDIGRQFLNDNYDPIAARQVFAVSSSFALSSSSIKKLINDNKPAVMILLQNIAEVLNSIDNSNRQWSVSHYHVSDIVKCLQVFNGSNQRRWATNPADELLVNLIDSLIDIYATARFDPFLQSLMGDLAPQSGKKIMLDIIKSFQNDLQVVISSIDDHIKLSLLEDDAFGLQISAVKKTLGKIESLITKEIQNIFGSTFGN